MNPLLERFKNKLNISFSMLIETYTKRMEGFLYFLFRLLIGLMFVAHGVPKLPGLVGDAPGYFMGLASLFEVVGGLAIATGFFVRLAALGDTIEMIVAYFMVHAPQGLSPLANGGELALLYLSAFLVLLIHGAGKYSLERAVLGKEIF